MKISARAAVDIEATVQSRSGLWGIFLPLQNQPWPEEPEPTFEEMTLREMLNLRDVPWRQDRRLPYIGCSDRQMKTIHPCPVAPATADGGSLISKSAATLTISSSKIFM